MVPHVPVRGRNGGRAAGGSRQGATADVQGSALQAPLHPLRGRQERPGVGGGPEGHQLYGRLLRRAGHHRGQRADRLVPPGRASGPGREDQPGWIQQSKSVQLTL